MSAEYFSPAVVAEVHELINACYTTKTMPLELAWGEIVEVWKQHGLAYETDVRVGEMLCTLTTGLGLGSTATKPTTPQLM